MTTFKTGANRSYGPGILRIKTLDIEFNPDGIPQELKDRQQWVIWALVEKSDDSTAKAPIYINGAYVGLAKWSLDRALDFDEAYSLYINNRDVVSGLGFMFSEEDPYVFIDFDKIKGDDDSRLAYLSNRTWVERSQSGKGFHMVVKAHLDKACRRNGVELYGWGRFCAMTGNVVGDCLEIIEDQELVNSLIRDFILQDTGRGEGGLGRYSDKGVFVLPDVIDEGNRDNTLFSYCGSLIWKGVDEEMCIRLMREANEERCKPPLHDDVVVSMVRRQLSSKTLKDRQKEMDVIEHIIFVRSEDKYFDVRLGYPMTRSALDVMYAQDWPGTKDRPVVSRWLKSQTGFKQVDMIGWMPSPYSDKGVDIEHALFTYENKTLVNSWSGWSSSPNKGNGVKEWLDHCAHIICEEDYRKVFIQWCAFMVRYPHIKCNWQVALVGIQGAGKDALFAPICKMLGSAAKGIGNEDITGSYDDGFVRTKLVVVSEARGLQGNAVERLKRICSSEGLSMQMMNVKRDAKVFMPNLWAVAVLTNNIDALKLDKTERRFLVLNAPKVMTTEMCSTYFTWLDNGGVDALMYYFLNEVDLSDFNKDKLPFYTTYFEDMYDDTRNDMESTLGDMLELGEGLFAYDLVLPDMLVDTLVAKGIRCDRRSIAKWLKYNGFAKYSVHIKISKKVDGKMLVKTRHWHYRIGGVFEQTTTPYGTVDRSLSMAKVYDECERIEKMYLNSRKF